MGGLSSVTGRVKKGLQRDSNLGARGSLPRSLPAAFQAGCFGVAGVGARGGPQEAGFTEEL